MARDIGGSDPERMSAANTAKYVAEVFQGTSVKVISFDSFTNLAILTFEHFQSMQLREC